MQLIFRQRLKTFLFRFSYPDLVIYVAPCFTLCGPSENSCYLGHTEDSDSDEEDDDDNN